MKRYFIIGTDTDCGKTYVTCKLLDYFNTKKQNSLAIKPIASGCMEQNGQLISQDVLKLQQHNRQAQFPICRWFYKPPISPHIAAQQVGENITVQDVATFCNQPQFNDRDFLLIESAGGLMSPINPQESWLDVLIYTQIPVIFVVGMKLGCLNHALLTIQMLNHYKISCMGWIANCIDKNMLFLTENIQTLVEKIDAPLLEVIPFGKGITTISE